MPTGQENAIDLYMSANRAGDARAALDRAIGARYLRHASEVRVGYKVFGHVGPSLNNRKAHRVTNTSFDTDEAGRIADHRDAFDPLPPREEWANSGKF